MLIEHLLDVSAGRSAIGDLDAFYREARRKFDTDDAFATHARERVVLLQSGDEETLGVWRELIAESTRHFNEVYALLGISLTDKDIYGESFYNPYLAAVVDDLEKAGLTEVSDGAVCVFPDGFRNREGDRLPLIVRKRDGGYGYAATDLATARYWTAERGATDLLYVVGAPQAQHFAMVFASARLAGYVGEHVRTEHVGFGSVLGQDRKMMKTRSGDTLRLLELLDEGKERALAELNRREAEGKLDVVPEAKADLAVALSLAAIKHTDLSNDRIKDYVFDWDRMLAAEGNTGPYLQYAHARMSQVLRKAEAEGLGSPETVTVLDEPAEQTVALLLSRYGEVVDEVAQTLQPHRLCAYLYDLAVAVSTFYEQCPVLKSAGAVRDSRLALCRAVKQVLASGLDLLGIEALDRM